MTPDDLVGIKRLGGALSTKQFELPISAGNDDTMVAILPQPIYQVLAPVEHLNHLFIVLVEQRDVRRRCKDRDTCQRALNADALKLFDVALEVPATVSSTQQRPALRVASGSFGLKQQVAFDGDSYSLCIKTYSARILLEAKDLTSVLVDIPLFKRRLRTDRELLPADSTIRELGPELGILLKGTTPRLVDDLVEAEAVGKHRQDITDEVIPCLILHIKHARLQELCCLKISSLL